MVPPEARSLFWDIDSTSFDPLAFPEYTIFRVLEYGDEQAVAWMRAVFSADQIRKVIRNERRLSPRSATYWALIYGIPCGEVAALKEIGRCGTAP